MLSWSHIKMNRRLVYSYVGIAVVIGLLLGSTEFFVKLGTEDEQQLMPLLIRSLAAAFTIGASAALFELSFANIFKQKVFLFIVAVRSIAYTLIITFWLSVTNGVWFIIEFNTGFLEGIQRYLADQSYIVNLISVFTLFVIMVGVHQINTLHRKGELVDFILGKYHHPREEIRAFFFLDIKGSTSLAEHMGHVNFGHFIQDYYSDMTPALRQFDAEVYQYVGDEIVLTWPIKSGKAVDPIACILRIRDNLQKLHDKYLDKYGHFPEFRVGANAGRVTVTWVGEVKKEIVFVGDVINVAKRIQEKCKDSDHDFLVSQTILDLTGQSDLYRAYELGTEQLRGKDRRISLYGIAKVEAP